MQSIFLMAHFTHIKFDGKFNHIYCEHVPLRQWEESELGVGTGECHWLETYFQFQLLWSHFYYIFCLFSTAGKAIGEGNAESQRVKLISQCCYGNDFLPLKTLDPFEILSVLRWKTDHLIVCGTRKHPRHNWFRFVFFSHKAKKEKEL